MTRILLCNDADKLHEYLCAFSRTVTVEAEYGDVVVEGTQGTLAHHGKRSGNLCPCLLDNKQWPEEVEAIGLSHIDLDAAGGTLAILGQKPEHDEFWKLAAFVDTHGAHRIAQAGATPEVNALLLAYWAWVDGRKTYAPRDGSVLDVTQAIEETREFLAALLGPDSAYRTLLISNGEEFRKAGEALNGESYIETIGSVIVRVSPAFVNHLYVTPEGQVCKGVVALNPTHGGITVSIADPIPGLNCGELVKRLWGPLAGGHAGIAGSPRNARRTLSDLLAAAELLFARIHLLSEST